LLFSKKTQVNKYKDKYENIGFFSQFLEDIRVIKQNDPAIRTVLEVFFNYPGFWAITNYRLAHKLNKLGLRIIARLIMGINQVITNIDIHPNATIGRRVFIDHGIGVVIGETAILKNDILIYQGVTLGGVSLEKNKKRHPTIENDVVIGAGAKVLGNITIGKNSKVGANSVVVRDVPENSTAIGIPARIIPRGRNKNRLEHNKIPDIDKELFQYLVKRVAILEHILLKENKELLEKELELDKIYQAFIDSTKN
jgi:serine O-acetyltransferase